MKSGNKSNCYETEKTLKLLSENISIYLASYGSYFLNINLWKK